MSKVLELQEQKGRLVTEMRGILDKAESEKRSLTSDEDAKYKKMDEDLDSITESISRHLKLEDAERTKAEKRFNEESPAKKEDQENEYRNLFFKYCKRGLNSLTAAELEIFEKRALSTTTGSEGGYLVPEGFSNELEKRMAYYGPMLTIGRGYDTETGNPIQWPTNDDTANEGELVAQNADSSGGTEPTFGTLTLSAYEYSSKLIAVPNALMQDSFFDMGVYMSEIFAERIGRILNRHFTVGTGSGQPQGIVTGASSSGITAAAAALTLDNLIDLQFSLDDAYDINSAWMFNKSTLKALMKIKDSNGNYIWAMGDLKTSTPDTILGRPYYKNPYMAAIGASNKSVIYGDFSKWIRRSAQGISIKRSDQLLMHKNQTAFISFCRYESKVIQPNAIKSLVHAAS